jgi:hypothetical protein
MQEFMQEGLSGPSKVASLSVTSPECDNGGAAYASFHQHKPVGKM